jgi:heme exporter protein B
MGFWHQFKIILHLGWLLDWKEKERPLACLFFSATLFLLMAMAFPEEKDLLPVQTVITLFLGIQMLLLRAFDMEKQGGALVILRVSNLDPMAWYLGKVCYLWLWVAAFIPIGAFFWDDPGQGALFCLLSGVGAWGLLALGILLSSLVLTASGKEVLFPVLFFPLSVPLLLASLEGMLALIGKDTDLTLRWLGLAGGGGVIYTTLGVLLFGEIMGCVKKIWV